MIKEDIKFNKYNLSISIFLLIFTFSLFGCKNRSPEQALENYSKGKLEYEKRKLAEAATFFESAIDFDSNLLPGYIMLGKTHYFNGDFKKSEEILMKGLTKFPGNATCHFWLARIFIANDEDDKALAHLNSILEADDTYFEANYYLAKLLEKQGKVKDALIQYNRAKFIKYGFDKIHRDLSSLYLKAGFKERAERELIELSNSTFAKAEKADN